MSSGQRAIDPTLSAMQEMERYCAAHPNSPVADPSSPTLHSSPHFYRVTGPAIEEGIAGFGDSVEVALRAFDVQYSALSDRQLIEISSG